MRGWIGRKPLFASLRSRLMLLVVLGALPALAVIGIIGNRLYRTALEAVEDEVVDRVNLIAQGERRFTAENRTLLFALAHVPQLARGGWRCRRLLRGIRADYPRYGFLGVADAENGRVYCSDPPADRPISLLDREYVRQALATGELAASGYQIGEVGKMPVISFAQPVSDARGEISHLIIASVSLVRAEEALRTVPLPPSSSLAIYDSAERLLLRYPAEGPPLPADMARRLLPMGPGIRSVRSGDRIWASAQLAITPRQPLMLVLSLPAAPFYAEAERITLGALSILGIALLLLLVIAWYGSERAILRPLRRLLVATQRLGRGDLAVRSGLAGFGGELGQLANGFDRMAANLEADAAALSERNREVARLNRVYAVLSGINAAILRAQGTSEVSHAACRIAVEVGGFAFVWIGLLEGEKLVGAAQCGGDEQTARELGLGPQPQRRLAGLLLRATPIALNDIASDREARHWRRPAARRGLRACAILPLPTDEIARGVLLLFAREPGFFDTAEMQLLQELATDLSFALTAIERAHRVEYLTHHDPLTGLPNRALFDDRLALTLLRAGQQRESVAVLLFEVDNFSRLASTLGRHIGDALLAELSHRLTSALPGGWTLARLGSADFGLIVPSVTSVDDATRAITLLFRAFPGNMKVHHEEVYVTTSIGAALFPNDGKDVRELVRSADTALRLAALETTGNSHRFFAPEMNARAHADLALDRALRHALEREEFFLLFQPLVEAATGRVTSAEALLRWEGAALGAVPPSRFVALLESSGLIVPVGEWVLRHSWGQAVFWRREGLPVLRVAVNASMRQLKDPGFVAMTERILSDIDYDPRRDHLGLELTESQLMENAAAARKTLETLKAMGLSIYIDDFGTGYSSLSYLKNLPLDVLKIDVSFIRDLTRQPGVRAIVEAILAMARSLQLQVVAEGVETEAQASLLRELRCDTFQGFLFSPPLPATALAARLQRG